MKMKSFSQESTARRRVLLAVMDQTAPRSASAPTEESVIMWMAGAIVQLASLARHVRTSVLMACMAKGVLRSVSVITSSLVTRRQADVGVKLDGPAITVPHPVPKAILVTAVAISVSVSTTTYNIVT